MDTCRYPGCDEPLIDWLDPAYCSATHRNRVVRAPTAAEVTSTPKHVNVTITVDTRPWDRAIAKLVAALTSKAKP